MGLYFSCCSDDQQDREPVGWQEMWKAPSLFSPTNWGGRSGKLSSEGQTPGSKIHWIVLQLWFPPWANHWCSHGRMTQALLHEVPMDRIERLPPSPGHTSHPTCWGLLFRSFSHQWRPKLSLPHSQWAFSTKHDLKCTHMQLGGNKPLRHPRLCVCF